jgi:hypothetical protein
MSTPISDLTLRAALAAACLFLSACGGGVGLWRPAEAPASVSVTADRIVVTGPEGFCVDPTATRDTGDTGFALLGNCAAIANSRRALQPQSPALLTAAISAPSRGGRLADSLPELDSFFRSPEGLALLSRGGDPASVRILETATVGDVFLLHASDTSAAAVEGVQPDYWRAYMDVGPRIATLSVLALEDRALDREQSLAVLRSFVAAVQAANTGMPRPAAASPVAPAQVSPRNLPLEADPLWNVGLFRRIFG